MNHFKSFKKMEESKSKKRLNYKQKEETALRELIKLAIDRDGWGPVGWLCEGTLWGVGSKGCDYCYILVELLGC